MGKEAKTKSQAQKRDETEQRIEEKAAIRKAESEARAATLRKAYEESKAQEASSALEKKKKGKAEVLSEPTQEFVSSHDLVHDDAILLTMEPMSETTQD